MITEYKDTFYSMRFDRTIYTAKKILSHIFNIIPEHHYIIDLGCGVGAWLLAAKELGAEEISGYDGDWVEKSYLAIPEESFSAVNLAEFTPPEKRYSLAINLEVAEHLSPEAGPGFIKKLTDLSDFVLFSAAIPHQVGKHHINEQWQSYWLTLFEDNDYSCLDCIRPIFWSDSEIPVWYRQNAFLYVKKRRLGDLQDMRDYIVERNQIIDIVHPELYKQRSIQLEYTKKHFDTRSHRIIEKIRKLLEKR